VLWLPVCGSEQLLYVATLECGGRPMCCNDIYILCNEDVLCRSACGMILTEPCLYLDKILTELCLTLGCFSMDRILTQFHDHTNIPETLV